MARFLTVLYAAYFFATSALLVTIATLVCLITAPFDPNRRLLHLYASWWASIYLKTNPFWRLTIEGREHIDSKGSYVLVANHQSYTDIFVLYQLFLPYKWVSKESIFKVPFIGWNMRLNQYVSIARGNLASIKEMMQVCRSWLERGASLMMFPEGTRSADGDIQHFRDGSFRLSVDCNVPVVPIVVDGTRVILPKGANKMCFQANIRIKVLPPVYPQEFGRSSARMRAHVHALMKETLAQMRGRPLVPVGEQNLAETRQV